MHGMHGDRGHGVHDVHADAATASRERARRVARAWLHLDHRERCQRVICRPDATMKVVHRRGDQHRRHERANREHRIEDRNIYALPACVVVPDPENEQVGGGVGHAIGEA